MIMSVKCKYNENGNYFENDMISETEIAVQERNNNWNYYQTWMETEIMCRRYARFSNVR